MRTSTLATGLAVGIVTMLGLSACDDAALVPPEEPEAGAIFQRYVALGASITAGFESGGINDSTQAHSWPALLADAMGTEFNQPLLAAPGCPPPFTNILEGTRVGGGDGESCGLRAQPIPTDLHNLAVPGAEVGDMLDNLGPDSEANALTQLILGGRTQVEAAADADPTFLSVFAGGNDILIVARSGDPASATPIQEFTSDYETLASEVAALNPEGVVLVGVPDIFAVDLATGRVPFPFLSLGAAYAAAEGQPGWPATFDVADNCAPEAEFPDGEPGEASLVPFSYGFGELFAAAEQGQAVQLDCLNDSEVLTTTEWGQASATVAAYNGVIQQVADAQDWAYADLTPVLTALRDQGVVPPFPDLDAAPDIFGPMFSQDGIHVALPGQTELAAGVAEAIDDTYGTTVAGDGS
ncbi:MAG: SGNH/GDSL hydrolase family protein [Gemmatimonadota bacterium]